jgi:carbon storage regulator
MDSRKRELARELHPIFLVRGETIRPVTNGFQQLLVPRRFLMLVLTRKAGERIVIDDNIVVEVLEVQGNRVRIGIQAPQGVTILRQELLAGKATREPSDKDLAQVS